VDRTLPAIVIVAVVLGLLALMLLSWRARSRRDAALTAGHPAPAQPGGDVATAPAFYVATTPRDLPLERLAIRGLGFRSRATLRVTPDGIWLAIPGEAEVYIPGDAVDLLAPATWAIDRAVETDGLLRLGWRLAAPVGSTGTDVDSYFRIVDPVDRNRITDAISSIAPRAVDPAGTTESEA
jgi:hypothetical protein